MQHGWSLSWADVPLDLPNSFPKCLYQWASRLDLRVAFALRPALGKSVALAEMIYSAMRR